jgi:hypothetical protein
VYVCLFSSKLYNSALTYRVFSFFHINRAPALPRSNQQADENTYSIRRKKSQVHNVPKITENSKHIDAIVVCQSNKNEERKSLTEKCTNSNSNALKTSWHTKKMEFILSSSLNFPTIQKRSQVVQCLAGSYVGKQSVFAPWQAFVLLRNYFYMFLSKINIQMLILEALARHFGDKPT